MNLFNNEIHFQIRLHNTDQIYNLRPLFSVKHDTQPTPILVWNESVSLSDISADGKTQIGYNTTGW